MKLIHICEVCGKKEILTPVEAFNNGWDYPPTIGEFRVVSPRTCGDCGVDKTLWWKIAVDGISLDKLSDKEKETLNRILSEPESILVED